jgi:hypothetical protein
MSELPFRVIDVEGREFVEIPHNWLSLALDAETKRRLSFVLMGKFPAFPVIDKTGSEPRVVPGYRVLLEELK